MDFYQTSYHRMVKFNDDADNLPEFDPIYDIHGHYGECNNSHIKTIREDNNWQRKGGPKIHYASYPGYEINIKCARDPWPTVFEAMLASVFVSLITMVAFYITEDNLGEKVGAIGIGMVVYVELLQNIR